MLGEDSGVESDTCTAIFVSTVVKEEREVRCVGNILQQRRRGRGGAHCGDCSFFSW
jgi:hypothetical protein